MVEANNWWNPPRKIRQCAFPHSCASGYCDEKGMKKEYAKYLASDLWKTIRARVLRRDFNICRRCGDLAEQVHHRNYLSRTLAGEDDSALVSLCVSCHRFISVDKRGRKRTLRETERLLHFRPWGASISGPEPPKVTRCPPGSAVRQKKKEKREPIKPPLPSLRKGPIDGWHIASR
jgi:hypothetical protein